MVMDARSSFTRLPPGPSARGPVAKRPSSIRPSIRPFATATAASSTSDTSAWSGPPMGSPISSPKSATPTARSDPPRGWISRRREPRRSRFCPVQHDQRDERARAEQRRQDDESVDPADLSKGAAEGAAQQLTQPQHDRVEAHDGSSVLRQLFRDISEVGQGRRRETARDGHARQEKGSERDDDNPAFISKLVDGEQGQADHVDAGRRDDHEAGLLSSSDEQSPEKNPDQESRAEEREDRPEAAACELTREKLPRSAYTG